MIRVLIYLDENSGKGSLELIEVVRRMYPLDEIELCAAAFAKPEESLLGYFDEIHYFQASESQKYQARFMASCIEKLERQKHFSCIIMAAVFMGRMTAAALAAKLGTGLVADVVDVCIEGGEIQMIRPAFEGKLMACITNQGLGPIMMTVRPGVFRYEGTSDRSTCIITYELADEEAHGIREKRLTENVRNDEYDAPADSVCTCRKEPYSRELCIMEQGAKMRDTRGGGVQLIACTRKDENRDICNAEILVSGGGGVRNHFEELARLAKPLGAMVSSSRKLVDEGIAPRSIQVGQSGRTVSPKLYLALGIYGSMQHIEGLKNVEHIISVNTNRNAPICSLSEIVVEGDAVEFIEKLTKRINQNKN